jgi:hypothetical protein
VNIAVLTYHPHIGTFRGARGAWRVEHTVRIFSTGPLEALPPRVGMLYPPSSAPRKALFLTVLRPLSRGTFVNPTKLLRELIEQRRDVSTHAQGVHA